MKNSGVTQTITQSQQHDTTIHPNEPNVEEDAVRIVAAKESVHEEDRMGIQQHNTQPYNHKSKYNYHNVAQAGSISIRSNCITTTNNKSTYNYHNVAQAGAVSIRSNCNGDCHHSSPVDCKFHSSFHRQSSQRRCHCMFSSSLSVAFASNLDERVDPHERELHGEEALGLETLGGPPAAKLLELRMYHRGGAAQLTQCAARLDEHAEIGAVRVHAQLGRG